MGVMFVFFRSFIMIGFRKVLIRWKGRKNLELLELFGEEDYI